MRAVIFDFYGTLAHFADTTVSNYETVFAAHGFRPDRALLDSYFARYDGVDHAEHSVSEEAYEAWVRARLRELTGACGVPDADVDDLIDALRASDQGPMVSYPEAAATLSSLREEGLAIGVCSNWGWELNGFLHQVGLLHLVDEAVTSAPRRRPQAAPRHLRLVHCRVGCRRGGRRLRGRLVGARRPRPGAARHDGGARLAVGGTVGTAGAGASARRPPGGGADGRPRDRRSRATPREASGGRARRGSSPAMTGSRQRSRDSGPPRRGARPGANCRRRWPCRPA